MSTIIVYGPQGCGKTLVAPALRRCFGCRSIVDDWDGEGPLPPESLVLTNLPVDAIGFPADAIVIPFFGALAQLGIAADAGPRMIRYPYSSIFVECTCGALLKDDCSCSRDASRSKIISAMSGVACSSNTD
jgi:hypothetical protein